jgi:ABC-type iron transport system FetAB permease component
VIGGALIGGLTSFGQGYLPVWVNSLSNSVGGWTMFCFLIVWLGRARPVLAAVLGVIVFQLLVESYSVVSEWRGFDDGDPFTSVWTLAGLAAGPLLGATAGLVRHAPPLWRALAVTPLCAVLLGEGLWALTAVADTTSPVYWWLEIVLAVVFLAAAILRCRLEPRMLPLVVCVWLVGALAYIGVLVGILS